MTDNKLRELAAKVLKASKERKIEWVKNLNDESSFKAELGNNSIYILKYGSSSRAFVILNDAGDEIGKYTEMYGYELEELYNLAKNKALKIDETLDDIDDLLDSMI